MNFMTETAYVYVRNSQCEGLGWLKRWCNNLLFTEKGCDLFISDGRSIVYDGVTGKVACNTCLAELLVEWNNEPPPFLLTSSQIMLYVNL